MAFSGMVLAHAVVETLRISVPTVVETVIGAPRNSVHDARLASWSKRLLAHVDVKLDVRGLEHVAADESYVIMTNHESVYDIPIVYQAIPKPIRMIAKAELFRIPVWGRAMRTSRFVPIDRGDRARAIQSLEEAKRTLADGISIWIAPEGTRSRTRELLPFKAGGFHLAIDTGAKILPVSIAGSRHILEADRYGVQRGVHVRVTVSPPIDARPYDRARRAELSDRVREAIARHREPD